MNRNDLEQVLAGALIVFALYGFVKFMANVLEVMGRLMGWIELHKNKLY